MKKNISINISGIIFHIEEDGYDKLKNYLDSVHRYFSSFDESVEIIADIESRIAEIFLSKLSEGKQVITADDVDALVATMGSVKDFKAAEDEMLGQPSTEDNEYDYADAETSGGRRLYRDVNRKIIGGVCAGVAHYFKIDPLWIRLLLVLLVLGSYGGLILLYIILWIVLPESHELKEDKKLKKMYRNPEDKVISGVSSGVAAYFGVDVTLIRILFIVFAFLGGSGLIAYILLWIILPEAKTITEKMQMTGDPITLTNIEDNIKRSFNVKKDEEENILVKIILFPFRLIGALFKGLGKALGPLMAFLVEFVRVFAGIIVILVGFAVLFGTAVGGGVLVGFWPAISEEPGMFNGIPLELVNETVSGIVVLASVLIIAIPAFVLVLLGSSLIARRFVFNTTVGWSLFAGFFVSALIVSAEIPAVIWDFQKEGEYEIEKVYSFEDKVAVLTLNEVGWDNYDGVDLRIRGHEGANFLLVQRFEAQGSSRKDASENAQLVEYHVNKQDSVLIFDSNIQFTRDSKFRAQRLEMTLYVPYNKPFIMDRSIRYILENTLYPYGYGVRDLENNQWIFTEEGELKCITCPEIEIEEDEEGDVENTGEPSETDVPEQDTTQAVSA